MSRRRKPFSPYRDQIDCAKRRILGYLERQAGAVMMGSPTDVRTLHRNITQPRDLGSSHDRQCATLRRALDELLKEGKIAWDDSEHMLAVTYVFVRPKKQNSSQRYAVRRQMRRAAA